MNVSIHPSAKMRVYSPIPPGVMKRGGQSSSCRDSRTEFKIFFPLSVNDSTCDT